MASAIYIPIGNPLNFTLDGYAPASQYNSKHVNDYQFEETIRPWESFVRWYQPWQINDSIKLQFHSQLGPAEMTLYDIDGVPVIGAALQQGAQSFFDPLLYIYQLNFSLAPISEGFYYMKIKFGTETSATFTSNVFEVREVFAETLLIEYSHFKHYADIYFENGFTSSVRIYGSIPYEKPGSANRVYENQDSDITLISTKPWNTWRLYTGGPEGIPNWAIMKYNIIVGCSSLKIDGKFYTKASDGASFEEQEQKDYPMRGWSIELRDKLNRMSKIITVAGDPVTNDEGLIVAINVESKGFVADDQGGSYYEVTDID